MSDTETIVDEIPKCDFARLHSASLDTAATVDGKTLAGPWAFMCERHFQVYGVGLGLGKGQRLVLRSNDDNA